MEKKTATTNYIFHLLLSHHPFLSPSHHRQHVPQTRSSSTSRRRRSRLSSWRRLRTSARSGWRTCCGAPSSPARPPHTPHPSGSPTPQHTSARSARLSSPWWTEGCAGRGRWAVWRLIRFVVYCIVLYCIVLYCIVLYCIVLYCIVLYYVVMRCDLCVWVHTDGEECRPRPRPQRVCVCECVHRRRPPHPPTPTHPHPVDTVVDTRSCTHSLIYSFIHLLTHSLTHLLSQSLVYLLIQSLIRLFNHSFIYSFGHHSFVHSIFFSFCVLKSPFT